MSFDQKIFFGAFGASENSAPPEGGGVGGAGPPHPPPQTKPWPPPAEGEGAREGTWASGGRPTGAARRRRQHPPGVMPPGRPGPMIVAGYHRRGPRRGLPVPRPPHPPFKAQVCAGASGAGPRHDTRRRAART